MKARAYCTHPSIRDYWALRCMADFPIRWSEVRAVIRFLWAKNVLAHGIPSYIVEVYVSEVIRTTCSEMVSLSSIRKTGCRKPQYGRERPAKFFKVRIEEMIQNNRRVTSE
ncbi:hypothetical protein TNCV_1854071 [Trichonephila clavipes]|nr:hypothetical protein TNCV_1854071 [Trichonephila clavipes]